MPLVKSHQVDILTAIVPKRPEIVRTDCTSGHFDKLKVLLTS